MKKNKVLVKWLITVLILIMVSGCGVSQNLSDVAVINGKVNFKEDTDTDRDGMPDYYELYTLYPIVIQEGFDEKGLDPEDDYDGDGLSSLEEYLAESNPAIGDTDGDDINDYEEVHIYKTNPMHIDTDEDGINDGAEIANGLDPLKKDTDNDGVSDGELSIKQVVKYDEENFGKVNIEPTLYITSNEDCMKLCFQNISYNPAYNLSYRVSFPFEIVNFDDISFDAATITFTLDDETVKSYVIEDLSIARYDGITHIIELLDTGYNETTKTLSADIENPGVYMVINFKVLNEEFVLIEMDE